ncbi:MAG: NAD-dependent epimerase/dehydratase family protein [Acidobacteriota bacterium]
MHTEDPVERKEEPQRPRTICVTGGAGFIGSHLVDAWLKDGHRVLVIDDLSTGQTGNLPPGVELHILDIGSQQAARLVETTGVDVLVHQAAQMNIRRSVDDVLFDAEVNVLGSLNLFEAARRGGVEQILFASTGGAIYGEQDHFPASEEHPTSPLSPYGAAKLACESYLYVYHQVFDLNVTCLRYANVYGPRQNPKGEAGVVAIFLERLLADLPCVIHGDGEQTRDYIYIEDVVAANRACLGKQGFQIYNVGTGIEASVNTIYRELAKAVGCDDEPTYGPAKAGEQRRSSIDPAKAHGDLALPTPISLEAGLGKTVEWYRRHGAGV